MQFTPVDIRSVLLFIIQNRKKYLNIFLVYVVITIVVLFLLPVRYRSTANLLPVEPKTIGFNILAGGNSLSKAAGALLGDKAVELDRLYLLAQSRTVKEAIVKKFNLIEVYEVGKGPYAMLDAIKQLEKFTELRDFDEGNFTLSILDEDPERAQAICSYYIEAINQLNAEVQLQESRQFRKFIETRYLEARQEMDSATAAVKKFQSKYGIFDIPVQTRQYFEVISKVSSEVLGSEIKYELLRSNLNANSEVLKTAQEELNILEKKLREIINRRGDNPVLLEYGKLPELGEMYWKLVAEREIKQELLRFIVPIYEQSKMEEKKALSIIKVIDPPDLPVKKAWPPRAAYLVVAILLATVLLLLGTLVFLIYRQNEAYFKQSLLG